MLMLVTYDVNTETPAAAAVCAAWRGHVWTSANVCSTRYSSARWTRRNGRCCADA